MMESMDLTPTPMSERPRSWRKWSRVCTGISGYDDRKISSGSSGRTSNYENMSSTERSGECCKKVSSCAVFLFFMFITFVLLHVLFLKVYMFMGTLFVRIKHFSFGL
ncbi:hypothetical protein AB205_0177780 [Aquarana catesbeiana]|uniref:Transmembrane protein n=1 Tax=Aquarana catesbeiana TaxID=8400 RepID=A0A2G9Q547_AQUCT|nr:hypothetical protein AB205_0177780 [Aquarana catesbeiana]